MFRSISSNTASFLRRGFLQASIALILIQPAFANPSMPTQAQDPLFASKSVCFGSTQDLTALDQDTSVNNATHHFIECMTRAAPLSRADALRHEACFPVSYYTRQVFLGSVPILFSDRASDNIAFPLFLVAFESFQEGYSTEWKDSILVDDSVILSMEMPYRTLYQYIVNDFEKDPASDESFERFAENVLRLSSSFGAEMLNQCMANLEQ